MSRCTPSEHQFVPGAPLKLTAPNYRNPRCTIGQWRPKDATVAVFPGSTVPTLGYVEKSANNQGNGCNLLLTGYYYFEKGVHHADSPNAHQAFRQKGRRIYRRTADDAIYEPTDKVEAGEPWDNLHAAFGEGLDGKYSSAGCHVVLGYPKCQRFEDKGPWPAFRDEAYAIEQKVFRYILLEAAEVSEIYEKPEEGLPLRLRCGSHEEGLPEEHREHVLAAQRTLGVAEDGDFGAATALAALNFQREASGGRYAARRWNSRSTNRGGTKNGGLANSMTGDPKRILISASIAGVLLLLVFFVAPCVAETSGVVPVALFTLFATVGAAFWFLARHATRLDTALEDSTYERFRRLEGLYRCIPKPLRESSPNQTAAAEFDRLREDLENCIDTKTYTFTRNDAGDLVHNLHLLYLQITPVTYLGFMMQALREDFRDAVGTGAYEAYLAASSHKELERTKDPAESERLLRADATFLVNQTRLEVLSKQHVETTRQALMRAALRSWRWNIIPLLAVLVIFLFCQACADHAESQRAAVAAAATSEGNEKAVTSNTDWATDFANRYLLTKQKFGPPEHSPAPSSTKETQSIQHTALYQVIIAAALLALAGIAGASGGLLSVIQRIQSASGNTSAGADLRAPSPKRRSSSRRLPA